jgi:hypothetical protein
MESIGQDIGKGIVDGIEAVGDEEAFPGAGGLLITHIDTIGWTVFDPKPCNPYVFGLEEVQVVDVCKDYKSVPPTLILKKSEY